MNTRELRQRRAALVRDAQALMPSNGGGMSAEAATKFDAIMDEADGLKAQIDRMERADEASREIAAVTESRGARQLAGGYADSQSDQYRQAFLSYLRFGEVEGRQRQILRAGFRTLAEYRAQGSGGSAGGFTIPQGTMPELDVALKMVSEMRTKATVLRTDDGRSIPWPTMNDTGNAAVLTAESGQTAASTDIPFGTVPVGAFTYRSLILAPIELLQDSAFDLETYFRQALGERIGRGTNPHFTTGTGTGQPKGIVTAAVSGATSASGTAVSFDDLVNLEHSVEPSYRRRPGTGWMFRDTTLKSLKLLKDSQNRPLWLPGLAVKEPDTILGHPYIINQDMAAIAVNNKAVVFGSLDKYLIRDVSEMIVLRLVERYADSGQVGYLVFSRHDGQLIDAGTNPVKYLTQAAV